VAFTPSSIGKKVALISINHNAADSPTNVSLSGEGAAAEAPVISISPQSLNFGSQLLNVATEAQVVTIRNMGAASLVIESVESTDIEQFPGSQSCTTASIAPGAACSIQVSFKPKTAGIKTAKVSIVHNASGSPSSVSLVGTGLASGLSMRDVDLALNVIGFSESKITGIITAASSSDAAVTYSIQTQGSYGVSTVNPSTGAFTYAISGLPSSLVAKEDRVIVKATAGSEYVTANVNISLRFDPLLANMWHLRNTGQSSFSSLPPVTGLGGGLLG
jgi:hypothetical protein